MKIERTKNATRNIVTGTILKIYQTLLPFIMRTVMIYWMGVEYLGLNSLFTSILQVLNLAELGVGSAMVYSMYQPIIDDDTKKMCALEKLYRAYYRIIGLVIAVAGIVLTPFVPKLIKSGVPADINIYILYLMNLAATVLTYWLYAYKNSILSAYQRNDVINKVTLLTNTIQYGGQIIVLYIFRNYYYYVLVVIICQILNNIVTAMYATKMYPQYKPVGEISSEEKKQINQRIRDLFTSKIGAVVVNSADTIVISAFLGLTVLAIYQNYFYIITAIVGFIEIVFTSVTAGIGNSLLLETKEKNFEDLRVFTLMIAWISGFACCCMLSLFQPFMDIWVGKELELEMPAVVCLCIYYFVYEINRLLNTYKDAGGIWHQDRFRPLVTAFANLGMNLIMVQFWGIYGIILSTVLSMLVVGMPWILYNLFTTLFEKEHSKAYIRRLLFYSGITVLACVANFLVCSHVNVGNWPTLIIRLIISCIIPNIIFLLCYRKSSEFKRAIELVDKMTHDKLKLSRIVK